MKDDIILQRILRDPKRVFIIGGYIIPIVRDDGKKLDLKEEYQNAIAKVEKTPNYPNFRKRFLEKMKEVNDPNIFDYLLEFPFIIENHDLFKFLLGEEFTKHHFRADIFFYRLGIIVELDSKWHLDPTMDNARDRYIEATWGIKTVRVELGLDDTEENRETLDNRFEEVWKVLFKSYSKIIKNRDLLRNGKPGNYDIPFIINYNQYLVREFRREERDTIKICEKYIESQKGFYTSDKLWLNLENIENKDLKLFNDQTAYFKERLSRMVSYIYNKDLEYL